MWVFICNNMNYSSSTNGVSIGVSIGAATSALIPEDVIFYVIAPLLCPIQSCRKDRDPNILNFMLVNKWGYDAIIKQLPSCWNRSKTSWLDNRWCILHYPMEHSLWDGVQIKIKNNRVWLFDAPVITGSSAEIITPGVVADQAYHISEGWKDRDGRFHQIPREKLVETFQRIFRGTTLAISHRCCGGLGIMYGRLLDKKVDNKG